MNNSVDTYASKILKNLEHFPWKVGLVLLQESWCLGITHSGIRYSMSLEWKRQKSTDGKLKRRKTEFGKYNDQHQEQMDDARTGKTYGASVALAIEKRKSKANMPLLQETLKGLYQSACAVLTITRVFLPSWVIPLLHWRIPLWNSKWKTNTRLFRLPWKSGR